MPSSLAWNDNLYEALPEGVSPTQPRYCLSSGQPSAIEAGVEVAVSQGARVAPATPQHEHRTDQMGHAVSLDARVEPASPPQLPIQPAQEHAVSLDARAAPASPQQGHRQEHAELAVSQDARGEPASPQPRSQQPQTLPSLLTILLQQ